MPVVHMENETLVRVFLYHNWVQKSFLFTRCNPSLTTSADFYYAGMGRQFVYIDRNPKDPKIVRTDIRAQADVEIGQE